MGTIAQLFESGGQTANEGLFKNLVMLARVDGKVDDNEIDLLNRIAQRLSLTEEQIREIIDHPDDYPMIPPVSKEERIERYIQFIEMTFVDGEVDSNEESLVKKYGIALGFHEDETISYFDKIISQLKDGVDEDVILKSLL